MRMSHLESYLREVAEIRATHAGVPETSYYPALSSLLNGVGEQLKPRVRAVIHIRNSGAGLPDGGLFTEVYTGTWADAGTAPSLLRAAELAEHDDAAGTLQPPVAHPRDPA